jgi:hypothetical protein
LGKRSNFKRKSRDHYPTPPAAIDPLLKFLRSGTRFYEPCAGDGRLRDYLVLHGHVCTGASDVKPRGPGIRQIDGLNLSAARHAQCLITNPPWERKLLHALIERFALRLRLPVWLLIDADWMHTKQAAPYLAGLCTTIVSVGRVKWIANSPYTGKDNVCWYRFDARNNCGRRAIFSGRDLLTASE